MSDTAARERILLIDDDDLSRELLQLLLEAEGYAVESAGSGEAAVDLLRGWPDGDAVAVLADLKMPGLCGADLAGALRVASHRALQAVVAMSASEPEGGVPAGYDGFLLKPFSMEAVASALAQGHAHEGGDAASRDRARLEVLDEGTLARLQTSMRPHQLEELFVFAMDDAERQIEAMRGAEADGDGVLYSRSAHSMKGSFGMLGAPELQAMAAAAETDGPEEGAEQGTFHARFSEALARLRHTLVTRGVCRP